MSEKIFVPPLKIQGIKTRLITFIRQNLPSQKIGLWLEPFMGSGAVGFNIRPERAVFADINPHIVNFYNSVKTGVITSDTVKIFLHDYGRKLEIGGENFYYSVRENFNKTHNPLEFLFLNRSCFNGMMRFNKDYRFNVPYGHKPRRFSKAYITKIANQVKYIEACLLVYDWNFVCQSFENTIEMSEPGALIYCDPPYIGRNVDYYDTWDEIREKKLCSLLRCSGSDFMLSTWDYNQYRRNEYIGRIWGFCRKISLEHFYYLGARETNRHSITEALLMNYPAAIQTAG